MEDRARTPTPLRLLRLWGLYARMDLLWLLSDARQALTYWASDLVVNLAGLAAVYLLAERFAGLGPWSRDQVLFMLGYASTVRGLLDVSMGYNVLAVSRRLGRGQLDHTLIQPQPLWMALLTEGFVPFSTGQVLLMGLGLLVWAMFRLKQPLTFGWLALLVLQLGASATVWLAFSYLWGSLAFWAPRAAEEISSSAMTLLEHLKVFPLDGLAPALLGGLLVVVPAGLVAWFPSRCLLGLDVRPWAVGVTPAAALALGLLAVLAFRKGLQHYGRTGSQRYSDFGHRR
jgi:ABC-2 type transport system permease protein